MGYILKKCPQVTVLNFQLHGMGDHEQKIYISLRIHPTQSRGYDCVMRYFKKKTCSVRFAQVKAKLQSLTPAKIVKDYSASLHSSPVPLYNVDLDMYPNVKLHIIFVKRRGFKMRI